MRRGLTGAALLIAMAMSGPAGAQNLITQDGWEGFATRDADNKFDRCILYNRTVAALTASPYDMLGITRDAAGRIGLLVFYGPGLLRRGETPSASSSTSARRCRFPRTCCRIFTSMWRPSIPRRSRRCATPRRSKPPSTAGRSASLERGRSRARPARGLRQDVRPEILGQVAPFGRPARTESRSSGIGTRSRLDSRAKPTANRRPSRIKSGAGFREKCRRHHRAASWKKS